MSRLILSTVQRLDNGVVVTKEGATVRLSGSRPATEEFMERNCSRCEGGNGNVVFTQVDDEAGFRRIRCLPSGSRVANENCARGGKL